MNRGEKLNAETKQRILAALCSGQKPVEIMREFNVCDKTVRSIRRAASLPEVCRRLTREEKAGIVAAIRKGESNNLIAPPFPRHHARTVNMRPPLNGASH